MLNTMTNKAIVTKARAMYGKRITSTQYDEMIKRRSVNDLATYLKNETHFQTILFGINESIPCPRPRFFVAILLYILPFHNFFC